MGFPLQDGGTLFYIISNQVSNVKAKSCHELHQWLVILTQIIERCNAYEIT